MLEEGGNYRSDEAVFRLRRELLLFLFLSTQLFLSFRSAARFWECSIERRSFVFRGVVLFARVV